MRFTPAGNLLIAGGANGIDNNNFTPSNQVWLVPLVSSQDFHTPAKASWLWWLVALILILAIVVTILLWRHHRTKQSEVGDSTLMGEKVDEQLWERICQLMDEQKPYLNSELKLQDFADMLCTNRTYIIDGIKAASGQTFTQFVNTYRVEQAKQLLTRYPDKKMSAVSMESGFATESSFFRIFKTATGITPSEWRAQETDSTAQKPQID